MPTLRIFPALALLAACRTGGAGPGIEGEVLSVDTVGAQAGVEFGLPAAALVRGNATFVLDAAAPALYRLAADGTAETIGRAGRGPGEFQRPSGLVPLGDSALGVIDPGNGRIQVLDQTGRAVGVVPFPFGPGEVIEGPGDTLYALTWGRHFALVDGRPVVSESGLVSVLSSRDGSVQGELIAPRPYPGVVTPLFGNAALLAWDPGARLLWVAWPLEPVVAAFDPDGTRRRELRKAVPFTPPEPVEVAMPTSPLPAGDFQVLTLALRVDRSGRLVLLSAAEPKQGPLHAADYEPPRQMVEILTREGQLACRVPLPVRGTALTLVTDGEVLIADQHGAAEVYRVRFRCPTS